MTSGNSKIIRTLCTFTDSITDKTYADLNENRKRLESNEFLVQTIRICLSGSSLKRASAYAVDDSIFVSAGTIDRESAEKEFDYFIDSENISFNIDLTQKVMMEDVSFLYRIIKTRPERTFNFAFTFNNVLSTPFFPAANFGRKGFSLGMQPTNLSDGCSSAGQWFGRMELAWGEIMEIFGRDKAFIGIDSSIAPLFSGPGSLIGFLKRTGPGFPEAVTTDVFVRISRFIKEKNPRPAGLCGIMFPCLEDFELAEEYERGNFCIERNMFLSLHSGLGIDTYPLSVDEPPERVFQVLRLLRELSVKYRKPLAARFVSDGKTVLGGMSRFNNPYLKDVVLRKL